METFAWVSGAFVVGPTVRLRAPLSSSASGRLLGPPTGHWVHYTVIMWDLFRMVPVQRVYSVNIDTGQVVDSVQQPNDLPDPFFFYVVHNYPVAISQAPK